MDLNQTTLRGILAQVLSVDQAYVVPKQGNWWNPQEQANSPDTWCAYVIRSNVPRTAPYFSSNGDTNRVCVNKIAEIDLQFVGPQAEDMAQGVAIWHLRNDVARALATVQGSIMYTDAETRSNVFYQDGANTVLAWNAKIKVNWIQVLNTTQQILQEVNIDGVVSHQGGDIPEGAEKILGAYLLDSHLYLNLYNGTTVDMGVIPCHFEFNQAIASPVWIIDHPLNTYPSVTIVDPNGNILYGDVQYLTRTKIQVTFSAPTSGIAYLN